MFLKSSVTPFTTLHEAALQGMRREKIRGMVRRDQANRKILVKGAPHFTKTSLVTFDSRPVCSLQR
jgi:hypothetical protein